MTPIDPSWFTLLGTGGAGLFIYKSLWRFLRPWEVKRLAQAQVEADIVTAKGAIDVEDVKQVGTTRIKQLQANLAPPEKKSLSTELGYQLPEAPAGVVRELGGRSLVDERMVERVVFEMREEQENLEGVVTKMLSMPAPAGDPAGAEPSKVWRRKFTRQVGEIATDEETRELYARLLAGEIMAPGRFSLTTLEVLANLSTEDVRLFEKAIPFTLDEGVILVEGGTFHEPSQISYEALLRLDECGLVHRNLSFLIRNGRTEPPWESTITALDKKLVISRRATVRFPPAGANSPWQGPAHMFTQAGQELRRLNVHKADPRFLERFIKHMASEQYDVRVLDT